MNCALYYMYYKNAWVNKINFVLILHPTLKVLVTGSMPTENLPVKSYDVAKPECSVLVRGENVDELSTSSSVLTPAVPKITSIECLSSEVDGLEIDPRQVGKSHQVEIRFSL